MTGCSCLHPEGYCGRDGSCRFKNEDLSCSATEDDLMTYKEFMGFNR